MSRAAALAAPPNVRAATASDVSAIEALMRPEVARGALLPRQVRPEDFLVAEGLVAEGIAAAAALTAWTPDVAELGSVVSGERGRGLGRLLVEAACREAAARGFKTVALLTGIPGFFSGLGFTSRDNPPWLPEGAIPLRPGIPGAVAVKAWTCAACPRLAGCRQQLMVRHVG